MTGNNLSSRERRKCINTEYDWYWKDDCLVMERTVYLSKRISFAIIFEWS